ncbi:MAG: hypothetical protein AAF074_12580 [Pseudomonadota bacterium]
MLRVVLLSYAATGLLAALSWMVLGGPLIWWILGAWLAAVPVTLFSAAAVPETVRKSSTRFTE